MTRVSLPRDGTRQEIRRNRQGVTPIKPRAARLWHPVDMFSARQEKEKQESMSAGDRLAEAIFKTSAQGLFLLDSKGRILPQFSASLAAVFRRQDFTNLTFEKLLAPLVTANSLGAVRLFVTRLTADDDAAAADGAEKHTLQDVEIRLVNPDGTFQTAHYSFEFVAVDLSYEPRAWLVHVNDMTARVQQDRELEDLRAHLQAQGEILRSVIESGVTRFNAFLQRTDASMHAIDEVLKKPAREAEAFRNKLEAMLVEVDRIRRDGAAFKLTALEASARLLEDALLELRGRGALSGGDFLPLAVKLDQLYGQFAMLRALSSEATPAAAAGSAPFDAPMTENGTQIIDAPKFLAGLAQILAPSRAAGAAQTGSLQNTLTALTELAASEYKKSVMLECTGMQLVPPKYRATIKNVAIQLIRNAVMHGVETAVERRSAGKPAQATLRLEFMLMPDKSFELRFQDDGCGLDPRRVRATAIAKGLITEEDAKRMRDRQAIKLIFKSGYTTLAAAPGEPAHGSGMSLVRRYVHQAGGNISLATRLGQETRFKVTLPALPADAAEVA